MKTLRYIDGVASISLKEEVCVGCGMCATVCPHGVFTLTKKRALITDRDGCMECGACAMNCPAGAIEVTPGVGCAALIIKRWFKGKNVETGACC